MALAVQSEVEQFSAPLLAGGGALGLSLHPRQVQQLLRYLSLLERWNAVHNLSASRDSADLLHNHLLDSLAIVQPLMRHADGRSLRVLDVGTGAGLPAVVLAIMQPTWLVTAVDAVAKKVAFVRQVAGELGLENLTPVQTRVESMRPPTLFDLVVSRAFSALDKFVGHTRHLVVPGGVWAAMKGKRPDAELATLGKDFKLIHVEPLQVPGMTAQRCLVWIGRAVPDRH
jgi:16S rRNA (guanine527-N7)-methyltransferase